MIMILYIYLIIGAIYAASTFALNSWDGKAFDFGIWDRIGVLMTIIAFAVDGFMWPLCLANDIRNLLTR